jgi:hypothetical protein
MFGQLLKCLPPSFEFWPCCCTMESMTPIENFDWVRERSTCTLRSVFESLRQQVKQDVEIRQSLRPTVPVFGAEGMRGFNHCFRFSENPTSFTVTLEGEVGHALVSFLLEPHSIKATDTNGTLVIEGTPSLNAEGKCVMRIASEDYPVWYFRMKALETLFFNTGATALYP